MCDTVTGFAASVENSGALALTKVGSQRVIQISAAFMLFFSVFDESSSNKNTSLQRNMGSEFSCMIKEAKILASTLGVPCVDSIEEGEAQCALLVSESLTDGCFSSDLDIFLFGARIVYRDICLGGYVICYEMDDIEKKNLDSEETHWCGYVKNVTPKGCFIMLSRKLDAKILISNLSDDFVSNPEEEFPIGKLVTGRVLSLEPLSKRIEVSLRKTSGSGRVKRVKLYGLFIIIDQSKLVGLCHVSELPEDNVDNLETKYKVHECVKAKVLKIDEERRSSCSFQPM
ncbi:putative S1 domain, XPG/Rad2 endonuclease, XPG-I domain, nucleic acid-binding protein [Helianthus annuus]|uniref:Putative XPG/Rad2 endonuclease, Nucleic acid-binding, OB-fold, PIN domain-like protein n=1 Tax=Helianthus annuus TaxID=4232 RepID=A0A251SWR1_HELAN|nr:putative XPG/Rad2 endonuclease, nucleic acid-binding, RNA-binding domain, S1 [Helianthus annuus]KAJ0850874.1 putative XPG/Rad2 endonuclease, nucleic acid-binding, RNA-binding domain, S1 [Helianthus annuus]KAJ0859896.1 putative S1 domain, XPG/Rad2 endonuclease, XPG-I domain, nucleic acid-binding protein [Helianthus annuus]